MFNNIMTKFKWGGMDRHGIFLDDVFVRSCALNMRQRGAALANAFIQEGKKDKAIKVIDKIIEVTPQENVPYDVTIYGLTMAYYEAGALDKANNLAIKLFDNFETNLNYYYSLDRRDFSQFSSEADQAQDILERLIYFSKNFKQDKVSKELDDRYNKLLTKYNISRKQG